MSNPHDSGGLTITLKYGKGYEESWAVFKGSPERIREDIIAYFGMDGASVSGFTLNEVVIEATTIAHGGAAAAAGLGGRVIAQPKKTEQPVGNDAPADDVWAAAEKEAAEPPKNPLLVAIESASSVDALKLLYAENQSAFTSDADLFNQWKAKGKSLKEATVV